DRSDDRSDGNVRRGCRRAGGRGIEVDHLAIVVDERRVEPLALRQSDLPSFAVGSDRHWVSRNTQAANCWTTRFFRLSSGNGVNRSGFRHLARTRIRFELPQKWSGVRFPFPQKWERLPKNASNSVF